MFLIKVLQQIKTHILCSVTFSQFPPPPPPLTALYEIEWEKMWYSRTGHRWQRRMRVAWWTRKVTNTRPRCV